MGDIIGTVGFFIGVLASILTIMGVLYRPAEDIPELKGKEKDLKVLFWLTAILFSVALSWGTYNFYDQKQIMKKLEKLTEEQERIVEKEKKQNEVLNEQKNRLESINKELEKKKADYWQFFIQTQIKLQNSIYNEGRISDDILSNVMTCVDHMSELFSINNNSIKTIREVNGEFNRYEKDSTMNFSTEQISYFKSSLKILENNTINTNHILQGMSYNLYFIMKRAESLNINHSREILKDMTEKLENNLYSNGSF